MEKMSPQMRERVGFRNYSPVDKANTKGKGGEGRMLRLARASGVYGNPAGYPSSLSFPSASIRASSPPGREVAKLEFSLFGLYVDILSRV